MSAIAGAIVGSALVNALLQSYTNKANIAANNARFAEQTELANTAHQREVADLRAAGLNPILSTGTAGAAVPSQQAAQVDAPSIGELGSALASAKATEAQAANANQNLVINEPKAEASKVITEFYKTDRGKELLRDRAILDSAPSNAYEAGYLAMRRAQDAFGGQEEYDKYFKQDFNPSSAKPSTTNNTNNSQRKYNFHFNMYNQFHNARDPRWRNPDGVRLLSN